MACGSQLLTAIVPDKENKRVFISNRNGQVFLYDIGSVSGEITSNSNLIIRRYQSI